MKHSQKEIQGVLHKNPATESTDRPNKIDTNNVCNLKK